MYLLRKYDVKSFRACEIDIVQTSTRFGCDFINLKSVNEFVV